MLARLQSALREVQQRERLVQREETKEISSAEKIQLGVKLGIKQELTPGEREEVEATNAQNNLVKTDYLNDLLNLKRDVI